MLIILFYSMPAVILWLMLCIKFGFLFCYLQEYTIFPKIIKFRFVQEGRIPNRVTASAWINGVCMNGQLQDVYKFIERIVGGGSVSMGDCYSSAVVCLIKIKNVEEAEKTSLMVHF